MGTPKALLELERAPLVQRHVERALALGCVRVLVAVRPELMPRVAQALEHVPHQGGVRAVSATTTSQASSLALLVRELARVGDDDPELTLLIAPVDSLPCTPATYLALCAALDGLTLAATPRFSGQGGHPVLVKRALLAAYAEGPLSQALPLRDVLAQAGHRRLRVDVSDPSVLADLDTPAQARQLGLRVPDAVNSTSR